MLAHQLHVATSTAREFQAGHEVGNLKGVLNKNSARSFVLLGTIAANIDQVALLTQRSCVPS